jgi:glycosyltransferase involved in cell wall biosynthesis
VTTSRPAISVVVPTRDRPDRLRTALAALRTSLDVGDELIVVDSASADPAGVAAVAAAADARLERCERPGASRARNVGWRAATHDIVGFVDDDVRVDDGWATAMVRCFQAHPGTPFVTGRIDAPADSGTMTVAVKDDDLPAAIDHQTAGVIGHSASLAVRRTVLEAMAGFDEALGAGTRWRAGEDTDLFDRILASGGIGRYEPTARATHDQWRRIRQWVWLQYSYGIGSGARLSKLWRRDRRRWRVVAADTVLTWGIGQLPGELVRGDGYRALGTVLRLLGVARGFAAASLTRLDAGHFRS